MSINKVIKWTIFSKSSTLGIWQGFEYAFDPQNFKSLKKENPGACLEPIQTYNMGFLQN